jgi:hypothetical protein
MGFYARDIEAVLCKTLEDLAKYAARESARITRIPVSDLFRKGARFMEDHSFGVSGQCYQFNEESLRACCDRLHIPVTLITGIEKEGLATDLLNDVLSRDDTESEFLAQQFVVDQESRIILGIVSHTYLTYESSRLLQEIERLFLHPQQDLFSPGDKADSKVALAFEEGSIINTRLRLRLLTTMDTGKVSGRYGTASDRTLIGFQFTNSMVGDTAVRIEFYLKRLVCTNGCVVPVGHTENAVFHSGRDVSFIHRLDERFRAVLAGARNVATMWLGLGALRYDPYRLAKLGYTSDILEILPQEREGLRKAVRDVTTSRDLPKEERRLLREAACIAAIPERLAVGNSAAVFHSRMRDSATLFDFVNVFTERAKEEPMRERVVIEERAGRLAVTFYRNAKKFQRSEKVESGQAT